MLLTPSQVWSPVLAKSILLRGAAEGDEVPVALEFLNFPPINGYSTELREVGQNPELGVWGFCVVYLDGIGDC